MLFSDIIGQEFIKKHLTTSVDAGRIAHAQLFVGPYGTGVLPMAIAYAQYILCGNAQGENKSGNASCNAKIAQLMHPDLHFVYPVTKSGTMKNEPLSKDYSEQWRTFINGNTYGDLYDWHLHINIEKKQGTIKVDEAALINRTLSLKSYEGGYKILIIYAADKMNIQASNKLLKIIEEPPKKTLILLLTENEDTIIDTIKSRCQVLHFPKLSETQIAQALIEKQHCKKTQAYKLAHQAQGDYQRALHILKQEGDDKEFEQWFVTWVRTAFQAKSRKQAVLGLLEWSEIIAKSGREKQKRFLEFCVQYFRQALLKNYKVNNLVFMESEIGFDLTKFAPFIHNNNIFPIIEAVQEASYHIERNGNAKIIFSDLSIKLTRLLHRKSF